MYGVGDDLDGGMSPAHDVGVPARTLTTTGGRFGRARQCLEEGCVRCGSGQHVAVQVDLVPVDGDAPFLALHRSVTPPPGVCV